MALIAACTAAPAGPPATAPAAADGPVPDVGVDLRPTVCLVPLGAHDPTLVAAIAAGAAELYGFNTRILPGQSMPQSAWYAKNRRWRADVLLDELNGDLSPGPDCDIAMGVTTHDISTTKGAAVDWGIFGLGEIGGRACVVSSFRLADQGGERSRLRRVVKVANHEIGHVLGLPHVNEDGCLMHDAEGTVRRVDEGTGLLCDRPRNFIEDRLGWALPRHDRFDWAKVQAAGER